SCNESDEMLNPFDLKAALLAKHAQHVVLIHFPIALFIAGVAFDFLAHWTKRRLLAAAAYCNFLAAALTTVPVLITGLLAWQWQLEGQRLKGTLLLHLALGVGSSLVIWAVWLIHGKAHRTSGGAGCRSVAGAGEMLPSSRCLPVHDRVTQCGTHCDDHDSFPSAPSHSQASPQDREALLRVRHGACNARRHCRTWRPVHFAVGGN